MVHYDSVEAAAEELGLTDLAATLDTHNAHALAGEEEDEFGRKKLPYLDTHDGVWVVSCIPTFYLTTGGLAIDTEGRRAERLGRSRRRTVRGGATYADPSRRRTADPTRWASTPP